jgi:hypothetical protein
MTSLFFTGEVDRNFHLIKMMLDKLRSNNG